MASELSGPLKGVKVIDLSAMISGPFAGAMLADQGAEVIKIEPVGTGDLVRYMGSTRNGFAAMFHHANRGKKSIALDLKSPKALEIVYKLVESADVVLQNFRLGVVEKLRIDYDSLCKYNNKLIYLSINGFGVEGPLAKKPAFDNILQAFAGAAYAQAETDDAEPSLVRQLLADKLTSLNAAQAITAALYAREQGHGGQHIQLSMMDTLAHFLWLDLGQTASFTDQEGVEPGLNLSKEIKLYPFKNGAASLSPVTDEQFKSMCDVLGVSLDTELSTMRQRNQNPEGTKALMGRVYAATQHRDIDESVAALDKAGIPVAKVLHLHELPKHPQVKATQSFNVSDHPIAGQIVEPVNPPRFSKTPSAVGSPSPSLGEHSDQVLLELGYSEEIVQQLKEQHVIA